MTQRTIKHLDNRRAPIGALRVMTFATCLAGIGLAACGGGGDGDGDLAKLPAADAAEVPASTASPTAPASTLDADGAVDVCSLITPADLSAAFGETFDAGTLTHHDEMGGDQCIWNLADPMSVGMVSLSVQRDSDLPDEVHANGMDAQRLFEEGRRMMYADGVDFALGDMAYTSGSSVHVLYEDAIFDFMTLSDSPDDVAALQELATSTIESLTSRPS